MIRKPAPLAAAILVALFATPAFAQESAPADKTASTLDTIIVTGTRVSDRTVAESSSPIDIITPETLVATGTTELATALARALPSLNFPRPSLTDGTDSVRPAQLRGLSPDQTLILVNGKRRHTSAILNVNGSQGRGSSPADLNAIPISAIARVEVLRDGASAQYGSDAIAGVVNLVLKSGAEGGSLNAQYGQYSAGDGKQTSVNGDVGFDLDGAGWVRLAGEYTDSDPTNRAGIDFRNPTDITYGRKNHRFGDPETSNARFFLNSGITLTENIDLYAFANVSNRDSESAGNFRQATNAANWREIYPEGFLPLIATTSKDTSLVAGVKGTTEGGWRWDVSGNYGSNSLSFDVNNSLNASLGPTSQTHFYAGQLRNKQTLVNADFAKYFEWGLPTTVAFGAEYRDETYSIVAGETASYVIGPFPRAGGAQVFPGFQPSDAGSHSRNNTSVYLEFDTDFSEKFNASIAARYEDYSDFGSTTSGKLSARYAFTDRYALRGTVASGFRAPSLAQQNYSTTSSVLTSGTIVETRTFPVNTAVARAFGAEPLKAEESLSYSLGFVAQPTDSFTLSIDAYQIQIDDRIVLSENLTGIAVENYLTQLGFPGVRGGRYFTNAVDTRTRGVDLVANWHTQVGGGALDLSAGYNYNKTEITKTQPNPPELDALGGLQRLGRADTGRIEVGSPRDKFNLGANYAIGNWNVRGGLTRYGEVTVRQAVAANDQTFSAEWVLDLGFDYKWDKWTVSVGGDNVLNEYPDLTIPTTWGNPATAPSGLFRYSSYSPFGFNGAFVYARVGYKW